ncbi:hypothetical protein [Paenisporosarcina sp. OV554]|uniref:hypothetical protein n=1 Tax=Paenisporosarcina sp. OV554 TaxID=2135694 RepID=UPI000D37CAD2|nr:hypothetical protein [Paenisporosarcina sp. OV554]PUB12520.1 hypothetical protein C8K15_10919 [Paenisporosarcina sp. OV554]
MNDVGKELSNSYSTGGGGTHFENRVQASFVVLMLTGGFSPCLPTWPIDEIKLQGKYQNIETDDLIIFVKQPGRDRQAKLLGQIKHTIKITKADKVFGEVIHAAWNDFNNQKIFNEHTDAIALITGPLSATDTDHVRTLLRQAQNSKDANDFNKRITLGKFTSAGQRKKLEVFKTHLKNANQNVDLTEDELWRFLKCFHLLLYDLDIKGVTLSLLHSLIGQYSQGRAEDLLALIEKEVTYKSENAGYINIDSIPENILSGFFEPIKRTIPNDLVKMPLETKIPDWNNHESASKLAIANLLGSWSEKNESDIDVISQLGREDFSEWISYIREILQQPESPVTLINGIWSVKKREELWSGIGPRIFDDMLEVFQRCAITVLKENDPMFSLPSEKRFAASVYKKELKYSKSLRKGIAESLVLLSTFHKDLINCSSDKPETVAIVVVREVFESADWELWGSLNYLLPLLAEAAPEQFLTAVDTALLEKPCPFDELFLQEGNGMTGGNYLTGLLWALETLAWDQHFLVRVTVILGELTSRDPGGNWANRPSNSLATIFLPWFPQTTASTDKRKVAVQTLLREVPVVGWKLLMNLLPNQRQTSSGSYKPKWRKKIPEDTPKGTQEEYWEQVSIYSDLAIEMASNDLSKLTELVGHLDHLPPHSFEKVVRRLSSVDISSKNEPERIHLWTELIKFASKHRRYAEEDWALKSEQVLKIEETAAILAPVNPLYLHSLLFNNSNFDLYEGNGNWKEQSEKLELRRQSAIKDIFDYGGINAIIQFAKMVESPSFVGHSLGLIGESTIELKILPTLLNTNDNNVSQFTSAFVRGRQLSYGAEWVDSVNMTTWSQNQIAQFLAWLPFTAETWEHVIEQLGDSEAEYWSRTNVNPYQTDSDLGIAIDKLIKYGRPNAAISCIYKLYSENQQLEKRSTVTALIAAISSTEPSYTNDSYHYVELIKALQNDSDTNPDDLFRVEWAYLPLLDKYNGASPKYLENRLATDSSFFSEVISLVYRSKTDEKPDFEPTEHQQALAENAYRLLDEWKTPPFIKNDGSFSADNFRDWLELTKVKCKDSGHLEVALSHIGRVLFYSPTDPNGLWINQTVAEALNSRDSEKMRNGFRLKVYNSRGFHSVDPTGKPEKELAANYRSKAEDIENAGFHRFAATLKGIADSYNREAEKIITMQQEENK